jgi:hypothetical protein
MDSLFEYRNCPNCGKDDFTVLFESNMKEGDFQEDIGTVYMLPGDKYGRHVKCRNCQLVYVNPIERAGKINENYSERKSGDAFIIQESRLHAAKSQVGLIKKYKNSTSLLDIGCGEGFSCLMPPKLDIPLKELNYHKMPQHMPKGNSA